MDSKEEYHDPDYAGTSQGGAQGVPQVSEGEKVEKIKVIIRREFGNELAARETEVNLLDQRIASARHLMHRLRYTLVHNYYRQWQLEVSPAEVADEIASQVEPRAKAEVSSILKEGQRNIHPSLRKLLGKRSVDLDEIFKHREPRNKGRKNYSAMLQSKNITTAADATTSLRPDQPEPSCSKPKKIPRHIDPKIDSVFTLNEATRNEMKERYRIIVGNTSKYAPAASAADRSSHKWLLYVRGVVPNSAGALLTAVTVTLHASYAPHHKLTLNKPPFHVSRRGWGEFTAQIELHFPRPERNPPALLHHTIKLDRHYTGLQTLGAETVVDVWLHSTPEMLPYIHKDDEFTTTDSIPNLENDMKETENSWLDFFSNANPMNVDDLIVKDSQNIEFDNKLDSIDFEQSIDRLNEERMEVEIPQEILKTTSPKKKIMKYVDPSTGKVYYLEMDRNFDLSKVQEIVINPEQKTQKIEVDKKKEVDIKKEVDKEKVDTKKEVVKKNGVVEKNRSLLRPQIKIKSKNYTHIPNDHCYLGANWAQEVNFQNMRPPETCKNDLLKELKSVVKKFSCVRIAVNFLLQKIPLVSENVRDPDFVKDFPFVVQNEDLYWKLDFAKRRNFEWSRAKLINTILQENLKTTNPIWRTKQILLFSRLHGYYPIRNQKYNLTEESEDFRESESESTMVKVKVECPSESTLSIFDENEFVSGFVEEIVACEDEDIDIIGDSPKKSQPPVLPASRADLPVLPINEEDRLRFMFIERKCAEIGIELRNEEIGHGYCYSAVHAVLLTAMKKFAEEMLRTALCCKLSENKTDTIMPVWAGSDDSSRPLLQLSQCAAAAAAAAARGRLRLATQRALAACRQQLQPL